MQQCRSAEVINSKRRCRAASDARCLPSKKQDKMMQHMQVRHAPNSLQQPSAQLQLQQTHLVAAAAETPRMTWPARSSAEPRTQHDATCVQAQRSWQPACAPAAVWYIMCMCRQLEPEACGNAQNPSAAELSAESSNELLCMGMH